MGYHGRLVPGVVTDPETVVELVIHQPQSAKGVTLRVWELDTFVSDSKVKKEGGADDLLAVFTGAIEGGKFKSRSANILSRDPALAAFKLRFRGSSEVHTIPILSEEGEAEGGAFELGFSLDVGGKEQFKTAAPCFFVPRPLTASGSGTTHHLDEQDKPDEATAQEGPLAHLHVCIGTAEGEGRAAKLKVLRKAYLDGGGVLVDGPASPGKAPAALPVRAGRKLYAWLTRRPLEVQGVSDIPIAACEPIGPDGRIARKRAFVRDLSAALPAEYAVKVDASGKVKLEKKVTHPPEKGSFAEVAADALRGYRMGKG